jgi:hypothetical protein
MITRKRTIFRTVLRSLLWEPQTQPSDYQSQIHMYHKKRSVAVCLDRILLLGGVFLRDQLLQKWSWYLLQRSQESSCLFKCRPVLEKGDSNMDSPEC